MPIVALIALTLFLLPSATLAAPELVEDIDITGDPWIEPCIFGLCPLPTPVFGSRPSQLTALGDTLVFLADDHVHGIEVWRTRGTEATTAIIRDIPSEDGLFEGSLLLGSTFGRAVVWSPHADVEVFWSTDADGQWAGIGGVCEGCSSVSAVGGLGDWMFFQAYSAPLQHYALYRTDGYVLQQVADLCSDPGFCLERVHSTFEWDGAFYYDSWFPGHLRRVFRLDGPLSAPVEVPTSCGWNQDLGAVGERILFAGSCYDPMAAVHRNGLWAAESPESEPTLVRTIETWAAGSPTPEDLARELTPIGADRASFLVGDELWWTDGTEAGTRAIGELEQQGRAVPLGSRALVAATRDGQAGLWAIDRDGALSELATGRVVLGPQPVEVTGRTIAYFSLDDPKTGIEPWRTDGTSAGTVSVGDVWPGPDSSSPGNAGSSIGGFVGAGTRVYFPADDGVHDIELWTVDESFETPEVALTLDPSPAVEGDEITATVSTFGECLALFPPEVLGQRLRLELFQGICDPPLPEGPVELSESLGQLAAGTWVVEVVYDETVVAEETLEVLQAGTCLPGPTALCLQDARFRVEASWTTSDGVTGTARAVAETADTGFFWFFDPGNIEVVVKVLDACHLDRFWVFAGGLTDVGVELTVTDTETGEVVEYENAAGQRFETVTDTDAFATCP